MSCSRRFLISQPASRRVGCEQRDPERHGALPARAANGEQLEFLLRRERSADVLRFRQGLVILADEVPQLELLQHAEGRRSRCLLLPLNLR